MDLATFQWIGGIAVTVLLGLLGYIARDNNEKFKDLRQELKDAREETAQLRALLDTKNEMLHQRINGEARDLADARETLAGFQGTFMTREEHSRYCQQVRP